MNECATYCLASTDPTMHSLTGDGLVENSRSLESTGDCQILRHNARFQSRLLFKKPRLKRGSETFHRLSRGHAG